MNVDELYSLTKWIDTEIVARGLPDKYSALYTALQQQVQLEEQKDDLIETIKIIELTKLTKEQCTFLDALGILSTLEKQGIDQIENILFRNSLDIGTATLKIKEIQDELQAGINKSNSIVEGLDGCGFEDVEDYSDSVLIRVSFLNYAAISDIAKFKQWGDRWHNIGRGIAMAHDCTPQDIQIVGATKGSVILELITNPEIAGTVMAIMWGSLKIVDKVQDIRKKEAEIKILNLPNKKIAIDLGKEAKTIKEAEVQNITNIQIKKLHLNESKDNETIIALGKSIKNLFDFTDQGGEMDFIVPKAVETDTDEETQTEDPFAKIRNMSQEIRVLEDKLKLLGYNGTESEENNIEGNEDEN